MIRLWFLLITLVFCHSLFVPTAFAAESKPKDKVGRLETGFSPDGQTEIELRATSSSAEGIARIELQFTDAKSRHVLDRFPFDDFASFATPSFENFTFSPDDVKCAWRSDNHWVALSYVMTRGFVGTTVYARWGNRWVPVELPKFYPLILKISHEAGEKRVSVIEDINDKGHESEVKWLPHQRMRLEASYRGISVPNEDEAKYFWVTFRAIDGSGKSKPKVVLESVRFAPDSAVEGN